MASLRKKDRSPYWFACFDLPNGERTQRSTKTTDRKAALKLAAQFEEVASKRATEAQAIAVISDIHEDLHGDPLQTLTTKTFREQWLAQRAGTVAPITLSSYRAATLDFLTFLGEKATQPLQYLTNHQITQWRDAAAARSSAATANNKLKILRVFLGDAWRQNRIIDNPAAKVKTLKTQASVRRSFTMSEIQALLQVANLEWRGLILFGVYTGQRLKDIASLTWANIDMVKAEVRLTTSKTKRSQFIPLAQALRAYLTEIPAEDVNTAPLFPVAYKIATGGKHTAALSQLFQEVMVAAGLSLPRSRNRRGKGIGRNAPRERNPLSFHSFRHTATSFLKNAGVSESVARDIIGHESALISRHYTHTADEARREAIDAMPQIAI